MLIPLVVDRHRLSGLLVYGAFASLLATVQDSFVLWYPLWEYRDTGPLNTHPEIAMLISLTAAPVLAMRFAHGLTRAGGVPWARIAKFTSFAMLPEVAGLFLQRIVYHQWWNVGFSILAYFPIWLSLWGLHVWLHRPARSERRPARS